MMNILTFDIEDWYNCDFITPNLNWNKFEVRIYLGVERILSELEKQQVKGTFFCLGWVAERHPNIIRDIHSAGHHIGCHSYKHELVTQLVKSDFKKYTEKSKKLLEDLIGASVNTYRAPGFSIKKDNTWAFEILSELGFEYDCSVFPAAHDYGGFPELGISQPAIIQLSNGGQLKEFPMSTHSFLGKQIVFSGGGFFRLFPYWLINRWTKQLSYNMTYFHPRDFDHKQPVLDTLPPIRKFKSYVGLKSSFPKFQKYLKDFEFVNITEANNLISWDNTRVIKF